MSEGMLLDGLLAPARSALVVVDLQNDYCAPNGALAAAGFDMSMVQSMCDRLSALHTAARAAAVPVVFLRTVHSDATDSPAWRRRGGGGLQLCRENTWGAEFYRIHPQDGDITVTKHRYSGFVGTRLDHVLRALGRSTLVMAGTATNVCVESTVRDGFMRDYDIVLVEDAAGAPDRAAHDATLVNVRRHFGFVTTSDRVIRAWPAQRS